MAEAAPPLLPNPLLRVVLFEPEKAGNVGNIARTCAVLGAELHLIRPFGFRLADREFKRAGMDYLEGVTLHDHNCGYKAYRRDVVHEVRLYGELHRFVPVLAAARGWRIGELPVHHRPRKFGRSKFGWQRFLKGFLDLLHVRFVTAYGRRPMHFFGTLSVVLFGIAVALGVVGCVGLLFTSWPLLASSMIVLGMVGLAAAIQMLTAGLLGELFVSRSTTDRDTFEISSRVGTETAS